MWAHYTQRPLFSRIVIEAGLGSVGDDERLALCEMSGRYESIRPDGVIIVRAWTAYKSVLDVTTRQTMRANELHQFPESRPNLSSFMSKCHQHYLLQTLIGLLQKSTPLISHQRQTVLSISGLYLIPDIIMILVWLKNKDRCLIIVVQPESFWLEYWPCTDVMWFDNEVFVSAAH